MVVNRNIFETTYLRYQYIDMNGLVCLSHCTLNPSTQLRISKNCCTFLYNQIKTRFTTPSTICSGVILEWSQYQPDPEPCHTQLLSTFPAYSPSYSPEPERNSSDPPDRARRSRWADGRERSTPAGHWGPPSESPQRVGRGPRCLSISRVQSPVIWSTPAQYPASPV